VRSSSRLLALIAFVALITSVLAPSRATGGVARAAAMPANAYCADPEELVMLAELNAYRAEHALGELTLSSTLGAAAKHHSESMASFNYFDGSHDLHFEGEHQDGRDERDKSDDREQPRRRTHLKPAFNPRTRIRLHYDVIPDPLRALRLAWEATPLLSIEAVA